MEYDGSEPLPSLHAEMMCLLGLKEYNMNFSNVKLYIYREDKNGDIANCRPCAACMKLIDNMGIKYIYYTTEKGYVKEFRAYKKIQKKFKNELNFRYTFIPETNSKNYNYEKGA